MVTHDHEEAFTVADDLAVMRAGRIVQSGPIGDVWRAPVDAETGALPRLRPGPRGRRRGAGCSRPPGSRTAPAVAVRRSALTVADDGPLAGRGGHRPHDARARSGWSCRTALGELDAVAPARPAARARETPYACRSTRTRLAPLPARFALAARRP